MLDDPLAPPDTIAFNVEAQHIIPLVAVMRSDTDSGLGNLVHEDISVILSLFVEFVGIVGDARQLSLTVK